MPPQPSTDQSLRAENAELRARLENAEEMLAQVSDAVIAVDTQERITFLNAAAVSLYGVRAGDVLGCALTEVFTHHWPSPEAEAGMLTALSEHRKWRGELIHRRPDGRELHVEMVISPLHGPDGNWTGRVASIRDVTDRIKIEQEKAQALRLLDTLLTRAPVGFVFLDRDLRFVRINERLAEINGFSIAAHLGRTVAEILPTLEATLREVTARILATGQPVLDHEFTGETARVPGVARYWNESWFPVHDERGEIMGFGAVVEEITGRKEAEAALRLSNERFNLAVKCSRAMLFQQDVDLRFTWLHNPAPGIDGSDAVGKREADLLERAEDVAVIEGLKREVIRSGVGMRKEFFPQIQGVGHCFEVLMEPLRDAAGLITGITGAAIDITELKRAEAARYEMERNYRALAVASSEVAYRMSADWSTMLPLDGRQLIPSSDQPLADWAWLDQNLPRDEHPRVMQAISKAIAGKTLFQLEHRVRRPDGSTGWTLSRAVPILDKNEDAIAWFGAASDITARKQAEAALAKANGHLASRAKQLESLVEQRTAKLTETIGELEGFAYSITHDLRAPLRAVNGFSQMLAKDYAEKLDDDGKRLLDRMSQSVTRMDHLILDVLQYSRLLRLDLRLEPVNADRLVRGMLDSYPDFQEPRANIVIEGELPEVLANEAALTQCFSNLLNNAIKFVPAGAKPRVTIGADAVDSTVRFWIKDHGIGIEPKYLGTIFGLFHRLSNDYEGTGVGLSIVRKAAERMGGKAGAESEPGQGSRFWFEVHGVNPESKSA